MPEPKVNVHFDGDELIVIDIIFADGSVELQDGLMSDEKLIPWLTLTVGSSSLAFPAINDFNFFESEDVEVNEPTPLAEFILKRVQAPKEPLSIPSQNLLAGQDLGILMEQRRVPRVVEKAFWESIAHSISHTFRYKLIVHTPTEEPYESEGRTLRRLVNRVTAEITYLQSGYTGRFTFQDGEASGLDEDAYWEAIGYRWQAA